MARTMGKVAEVAVARRNRVDAGSCVFCGDQTTKKVWVVFGGNVEIRLCDRCFDEVRTQINRHRRSS